MSGELSTANSLLVIVIIHPELAISLVYQRLEALVVIIDLILISKTMILNWSPIGLATFACTELSR
jgi:hypothetical protein